MNTPLPKKHAKKWQFRSVLGAMVVALLGGLSLGVQSGSRADTPGRHAYESHAYSNLSAARSLLAVQGDAGVVGDEKAALFYINKALYEVQKAAGDDKKSLVTYPVDPSLSHAGRLHKAVALLAAARTDLSAKESDANAQAQNSLALQRIDASMKHLQQAISRLKGEQLDGLDEHPNKR